MIKNVELAEFNINTVTVFLNAQILKMIWYNTNVVTKITNKILMKS